MKSKLYSISSLVILTFYILRPILPYVEYSFLKDYIAKNLCINKNNPESTCDGKCFLEKELKKSLEQTESDNDQNKKILPENKVDDHVISDAFRPSLFVSTHEPNEYFQTLFSESHLSVIFVPPRKKLS